MGKTLYFNIPAQGHVNPMLAVLAELVQRGEQVVCINTEEFCQPLEATGATFLAYPLSGDIRSQTDGASGGTIPQNALALAKLAELLLPWVFEVLDREKPDYVIHDSLAGWAKQVAEVRQIPGLAIVTTLAIPPGMLPPITPSMAIEIASQMLPVLPRYWSVARRMRQRFGVKTYGLTGVIMNTNACNIVFTSAQFQPGAAALGDTYRFVGPSFIPARCSENFPFEKLTDQPLIYISLGTINNNNPQFYQQCFAAFQNFPAQFVLSIGKRIDPGTLGTIPANFVVQSFVPQIQILERASLFITHGGMNSVHEGLSHGVPLIVVPQQLEQAVVARQVATNNAGIVLGGKPPFGKVTIDALRQAVVEILGVDGLSLNQRYQVGVQRLGESFRAAGGAVRAADEILAFARGSQTRSR